MSYNCVLTKTQYLYYATQKNVFVIGNIIQIGNIDGAGGHNHYQQQTADALASVNSRINELETQIQLLTKIIEAQQENIKLLCDKINTNCYICRLLFELKNKKQL